MKKLITISLITASIAPTISLAQSNDSPYQPKFIGSRNEEIITIEEKRRRLIKEKQVEGKPINIQGAITPQEKYNNQLPENLAKKLEEEKASSSNNMTPQALPENMPQNLREDVEKAQNNAIRKALEVK